MKEEERGKWMKEEERGGKRMFRISTLPTQHTTFIYSK